MNRYYNNVDWKSLEEVEDIGCCCKKLYYGRSKKPIYYYKEEHFSEYFTKELWYIFRETSNYHHKEFKTFFLYFNKELKECWLKIIAFLDKYVHNITKCMNVPLLPKIEIYIISNAVMDNLFGSRRVSGFFDPLKDKIYLDDLDINATHEIIHSIMNKWGISANLFCNEGMAECFKRPIDIPRDYILDINSFRDIFFDWVNLSKESYGVGGLFFRYLYKKYGVKMIKKICEKSNGANSEKMEYVIKSFTKNNRIENDFVEWFRQIEIEREDWYFQY